MSESIRIKTKSGEERDLHKMRNCAVFLGEPAATELTIVIDALVAALSVEPIHDVNWGSIYPRPDRVAYNNALREVGHAAGRIDS